jgi:hypothetical protein
MTGSGGTAPIAPTDRVSDVIARDEALVDVFVRAAPHFSKLRNRAMRRVMARLITVEQAARTAGIPPERLVHDLNAALGIAERADDARSSAANSEVAKGGAKPESGGRGQPGGGVREDADAVSPTRPANAPVREVDVREDLRAGNEPFSKIMAAVAALGDREILRLRTTFEPVPLFTVLGKRGFVHVSEEHGADDWSVWFWRPADDTSTADASSDARAADTSAVDAPPAADTAPEPTSVAGADFDDTTLVLDVRGLEPPEPLLRTLAALETLPEGHQLLQINARVPQFLFPMLVERGFACDVDESHADRVLVRIWRPA